MSEPAEPVNPDNTPQPQPPGSLDFCPRCGEKIAEIIWGQTNCPSCGLHFECC